MLGITARSTYLKGKLRSNFSYFPKSWQYALFLLLFYAVLTAAILAPISSTTNIPNLADFFNHLAALIQAKIAITQGQFPLRTAPVEMQGWLYPYYQFYSPTVYTFGGLIYAWLSPSNPLIAYQLTMWCALMIGMYYMYQLTYWFVRSKPAAILASVAYLYSPYYIIVINHLGNLTEAFALGILPAVLFYSFQRYYRPYNDIVLLKMGLAWYLLITSHIVTFVYTSLFFFLLLFIITVANKNHWRNLMYAAIGYGLGILLATWYIAPINLFKTKMLISETFADTHLFNDFHPSLSQLLFSGAALTSNEKTSALHSIHPAIGWPMVAAIGICLYGIFNKLTSASRRADYFISTILILFFLVFFMVWSPFNFWKWLPHTILAAQFSWRLLGQAIWLGALIFAWAVCWLFRSNLTIKHILIGTLLIAFSANSWFPTTENAKMALSDFEKNPLLIYNDSSYLINFNKYTNYVSHVDSILIDYNHLLQLNVPYLLPANLLKSAFSPTILLSGNVPATFNHQPLQVHINDKLIKNIILRTGKMEWSIPLEVTNKNVINSLVFTTPNQTVKPSLPLDKVLLTGFLNPQKTVTLAQVQPHCFTYQSVQDCHAMVPSTAKLLELPVLYYPDLLHITLNGKTTPYTGTIYQGKLIASIKPLPGKLNHITAEFRGLAWANYFSWLGWSIWIILLIQCIQSRKKSG